MRCDQMPSEQSCSLLPLDQPQEYWRGRVVAAKRDRGEKYGHILRFTRNPENEINVIVLWEDGGESAIHPRNLALY